MQTNVDLSKTMSHALRHEPWLYELEPDDQGWVPVDRLLSAIRRSGPQFCRIDRASIAEVIERSAKQRFEIQDGRIRALYGHSLPGLLRKQRASPPEILFHGTSPEAVERILTDGLRPMDRQYVHLSVERDVACEVGRRKSRQPVLLQIRSAEADAYGVAFLIGNDAVWLAKHVPSLFVELAD